MLECLYQSILPSSKEAISRFQKQAKHTSRTFSEPRTPVARYAVVAVTYQPQIHYLEA